ncbi:hypothetical protein IJH16_01205 [Candidatus Saccharibacteria bacterium]|nr:hypothetical protein [Candidatus Saccharibacteria bacterium]
MGKLFSLLKASMTDGMQIFRISKNSAKGKKSNQTGLLIAIAALIGFSIWVYADKLLDSLTDVGAGFVVLTLFVIITSVLTLVEGIYKSGDLLFNCRDDDLMLSLPIKKSTVLFIRVFKLYVFELLYNSLFLIPAMIAYAIRTDVSWTFYLSSLAAILLLPIVPIVIGCIIGGVIVGVSSRFRLKNLVQIIVTMAFLLGIFIVFSNINSVIAGIAANATSINDVITRLYYPAGAYIGMVTNFSIINFLIFIAVHIAIFGVMLLVLSKIYYKINSRAKTIKIHTHKTAYKIKRRSVIHAIIAKEFNKFINTPVFVINAGFGLVLFVVACVLVNVNLDSITSFLQNYDVELDFNLAEIVKQFAPAILFCLIVMASVMSSITSSMISLEGRAFNILKSIPVKPTTIIISKVLAAVLVMLPFILIGDLIMFAKFDFNLLEIILILLASIVLPLLAELIGIALNLKYPKMNAENDAEVVKQSISTLIATFLGMGITALTIFIVAQTLSSGAPLDLVLGGGVVVSILICTGLIIYVDKIGTKKFLQINV